MGSPSRIFGGQPHNISWNLPSGFICGGKTSPSVYQKDPIELARGNTEEKIERKGGKNKRKRAGKMAQLVKALPAKYET